MSAHAIRRNGCYGRAVTEGDNRAHRLPIRAMTKESRDLELFAACFAKNSAARTPESLRWQYVDNPSGELFVDFAVANDRLAAIYATLPVRMRIDGVVGLALQSVDTITDVDFRGKGLFLELARTTYARAQAAGAALVYGFPNAKSAHGFFERLEWTRLDPVPFLIRPLRTSYVFSQLKLGAYTKYLPDVALFLDRHRVPRRGRLEIIERFDERATELWHSFAATCRVAVERDARYLNWRLVDKPFETYETEGVFDGVRLVAFVTTAVKDKHGGRIGYVMESLCAPGRERDLRLLFSRALGRMVRHGADVALAWCLPTSPTFTSFLRSGFVPFPERLRPIELHAGARNFSSDAAVARERQSWYLSYTDADTT
jgi:hypothetical protein